MHEKVKVKIRNIKTIDEIPGYWTTEDYKTLLEAFDFSDIDSVDPADYQELLYMAITDFEPDEAAKIMLQYKFSDQLSDGQMNNLSHEMLEDKVAEEYPDPSFHYGLFNINQLLFKAYNGTFPTVKASKIDFQMLPADPDTKVTKAFVLKALANGLSEKNLIKRLYEEALTGKIAFKEAPAIVWEFHSPESDHYTLITSDYWLNKEDFTALDFEGFVVKAEKKVLE